MFFNAILPPWFLVHNFQNRVTCTNKPSSHTVSFVCVSMVPCKPISCPKALQKEQKLLKAGEMHYAETLVFHFGSGGNSPTALASSIPVVPKLKRQTFLPDE